MLRGIPFYHSFIEYHFNQALVFHMTLLCSLSLSLLPQDPNSIVMTIDMHLTIPPGIVEYIRRVSYVCKCICGEYGEISQLLL